MILILVARSSINHSRYWHCAFPFPDNSVLVQRSVIEKIAEGKGIRPKKEFPHVVWCIMHDWDRPGIVKVPYVPRLPTFLRFSIFDLQRGLILYPLICGNCERENNGYAFKYEPLAYTVVNPHLTFLLCPYNRSPTTTNSSKNTSQNTTPKSLTPLKEAGKN